MLGDMRCTRAYVCVCVCLCIRVFLHCLFYSVIYGCVARAYSNLLYYTLCVCFIVCIMAYMLYTITNRICSEPLHCASVCVYIILCSAHWRCNAMLPCSIKMANTHTHTLAHTQPPRFMPNHWHLDLRCMYNAKAMEPLNIRIRNDNNTVRECDTSNDDVYMWWLFWVLNLNINTVVLLLLIRSERVCWWTDFKLDRQLNALIAKTVKHIVLTIS